MKFIVIKNIILILLIAGISLSETSIQAMDERGLVPFNNEQGNREANIVSPYVNAATSLAVARYVPDIAESLLPRINPNYPLTNALVPAVIKFGGYALGTHFVLKKGLKINYSDFMKRQFLEKVATNTAKLTPLALCHPEVMEAVRQCSTHVAKTYFNNAAAEKVNAYAGPIAAATGSLATTCMINPNLAPATLCHPQVAQLAADCCTNLASSCVSEDTLETLNKYVAPTLMAAGALGTLYLVNRNIFDGKLWKKVKRVCKDVRPYLWLGPLASAYNADVIKNYAMSYAPLTPGSNLHSDVGTALKATMYWGSLGAAAYLFTTEMLGVANQGYLRRKINRLLEKCTDISEGLKLLMGRVDTAQTKADELKTGQLEQNTALFKFATDSAESTKAIARSEQTLSILHAQSTQAIEALEKSYENICNKAQKISVLAPQIIEILEAVKKDHAKKIEQLRTVMGEQSKELLALIAQEDKKLEEEIIALETACKDESTQLEQSNIKLQKLLELLDKEKINHIDQKKIEAITQGLEKSTQVFDIVTKELTTMIQTNGDRPLSRSDMEIDSEDE